ncbi:MAG TPA: hypothetical protein VEY67_10330 [Candidatus Dormibacteraeota bacterium]|nr:hypothetical protein [Candidatus Dormibacteraeota bacterium]
MIGSYRSSCGRHREALSTFADRRDPSVVDSSALDHLDRCPACRHEVEAEALTIVALRRLGAEAAAGEPPADAWPRLRRRVDGRAAPWRWRTPLAGLLVSAGIVTVVLAPAAYLRPAAPYIQEVGLESSIFDAARAAEDRQEAILLESQMAARTVPVPLEAAPPADAAAPVDAIWFGPDGIRPARQVAAPAVFPLRHE